MPAVLTLAAIAAQCVPAHWFSPDPKSLDLLAETRISCLIVDRANWNPALVSEAHTKGLKVLATDASSPGADATVAFDTREHVHAGTGLVAIGQGVWPGLRTGDDVVATPSAAPWVDTNLGYLRYLRSEVSDAIWVASRPPPGQAFPLRRYEQVMGDAALAGARWIIDIDEKMASSLVAGDPAARKDWSQLTRLAAFLRAIPDLGKLEPYSRLGVSVAPPTGGLVSGGVLDMIGAQHIPFHVVNTGKGMEQFFDFADNSIVKFPKTSLGRTLVRAEDVGSLEPVYRRVEVIVGRTNFGLRVFNGAGILSAPYSLPGGAVGILLVNYTSYPAENITLHVLGTWKKATLEAPGQPPKTLNIYSVKTATAVEIDSLDLAGFVRVE
jgi:hypothetical protein